MAPGQKPEPPGSSDRQRTQWKRPDSDGWQFGSIPRCPNGLTADGQRAWKTWLGSWWAAFYTPDDLPGLELAVKIYDGVCAGHIDIGKAIPILDRYGITPKGRQDLRWAERPSVKPSASVEPSDEIAARRETRKANLA